jgi:outer membrane PBP1 activator LpoA protein
MAAYHAAQKTGSVPTLHFYDSKRGNPVSLYQLAIKEGAQLCVGPLDKQEIKALVEGTDLTIPVLALNYVEGLHHPKLYQFGLSPSDDALQIALKAHHDGHQNAALLVPKTEQGKRFAVYLRDSWQKLAGHLTYVQAYNESRHTFDSVVTELESALQSSQKTTDNADAVILNAYPKPARALTAALQANENMGTLAVYATAQLYTGDEDVERDRHLTGVTFCDVPWMFNQAYGGELSKSTLKSNWQSLPTGYLRLLPLGIDAYNIINHLDELKTKPYSGASGRLTIDANNRLNRELFCAQFSNGLATPLGFASESSQPPPETMLETPKTPLNATDSDAAETPKSSELNHAKPTTAE